MAIIGSSCFPQIQTWGSKSLIGTFLRRFVIFYRTLSGAEGAGILDLVKAINSCNIENRQVPKKNVLQFL